MFLPDGASESQSTLETELTVAFSITMLHMRMLSQMGMAKWMLLADKWISRPMTSSAANTATSLRVDRQGWIMSIALWMLDMVTNLATKRLI